MMRTRAANTAMSSSTKFTVRPAAASHARGLRTAPPDGRTAAAASAVGRILGAATGHPAELRRGEGNGDAHGLSFHGGRGVGGEPDFKAHCGAGPLKDRGR